ncbi:phage major capsid protein [Nocardiopsis sp. EMB25]|uniref:phage major capsid protein n=1 Tax=Nocardiopsis sp. EMB25 TaxID=2835867 RepID=UPI0022848F8D|nr:phage major capsid protein [Nocardiopsis sp. EMB25]MCY9786836.1 phage major capsid protein [Nocardiopsis sp. EMB25]
MNLKAQLDAALKRAKELNDIAAKGDLSEEQITEATALAKTIEDLRAKIKAADDAAALVKGLAADDGDAPEDDPDGGEPATPSAKGGGSPGSGRKKSAGTFGEKFTKSAPYQAFKEANPSGVGHGTPINIGRVKVGTMEDWASGRKATLTTATGLVQNVRMPMVDLVDRDRLTLLDLISRGQTGGNFEYVQVTGVTRNAAVVPESTGPADANALKPTSDMTTNLADAKVYTYADGYDVTNQLLADAPAFASYMDNELRYSLDSVVEDKLLNGTGVSGEPLGILATTGVQEQTYTVADTGTFIYDVNNPADVMALVKAIRKSITRVTRLGGTVTAILLSPEDDEAIDLLQDANDRFYGQGPFGSGPGTLWGRTRVTSERLTVGEPLLGDFRQVALLDREGLSVMAFNQHKDYAQRNMTYVRAELRAAQVLWRPNRLVVTKPATS